MPRQKPSTRKIGGVQGDESKFARSLVRSLAGSRRGRLFTGNRNQHRPAAASGGGTPDLRYPSASVHAPWDAEVAADY